MDKTIKLDNYKLSIVCRWMLIKVMQVSVVDDCHNKIAEETRKPYSSNA